MMNLDKKYLFLFAILIFCLQIHVTNAGYYDFYIQDNLVDNTIKKEIGNIIINRGNAKTEDFDLYMNSNNITINTFDKIFWKENNVVGLFNSNNNLITELSQNNYYILDQNGRYFLKLNNTLINEINVISLPSFSTKIVVDSEIINFKYDNNTHVYSDSKIYEIGINDLYSYNPKKYQYTVKVFSAKTNKTINKEIMVENIQNWTITKNELINTTEAKAGDIQSLGVIEIKNTGNFNTLVKVDVDGNISNYIKVENEYNIYKDSNGYISVFSQIPVKESDKFLSGNITIYNDFNSESFPLRLFIKDLSVPEIKEIKFEHNNMMKNNEILVLAYDNIDVKGVYMKINNTKINFTKDQQRFNLTYLFDKSEYKNISFCAFDNSNNVICKNKNLSLDKLDLLKIDKKINMKTVRKEQYNNQFLLNITEIPYDGLNITLNDFRVDGVSITDLKNYSIKIMNEDENEQFIFSKINESYTFLFKGKYNLEIKSQKVMDYEGEFVFSSSEFVMNYKNSFFEGSVGEYTTPEDQKIEWFNTALECFAKDTGIFEDSKYICSIEFPIDTDLKNNIIPVSVSEKEAMEDKNSDLKLKIVKQHLTYLSVIGVLVVFVFIIIGYVVFESYFKTRMLVIKGRKE